MLHKTRGIVFKTTDYSESSVVVQVFTEKFGMQSYLVNGAKKPRARIRQNMLQPLHLLDMVVYHKPTAGIQRISDLKNDPVLLQIPYHVGKSSIVFFLNEVLYKCIRQQTADEVLFEFLFHAIHLLDTIEDGLANFHLFFLMRLSQFLGFYPRRIDSGSAPYFDLYTGSYCNGIPAHAYVLQPPHTGYWTMLIHSSFETLNEIHIPLSERRFLLEKILDYYRLHVSGFGEIKSHQVLEEVLG